MNLKFRFLLLALAVALVPAAAQAAATAESPFTSTTYIQYPSLNPVTAIHMRIGVFGTKIYDVFQAQLKKGGWDCTSPAFYKVMVVDKNLKPMHPLVVTAIRPIGFVTGTKTRYTTCVLDSDGSIQPGVVDLVLGSHVSTTELVQVIVYADSKQTAALFISDGKLSVTTTNIPTFTATPQAAPGEALNEGATRTVGQLSIAFSDLDLSGNLHTPVNFYAKSTDLLSTDGKDTKSSIVFTGGLQRGLLPKWYSPFHLEQTLQGNQTAKNLSTVTNLGFATDPRWSGTSHILKNSFILAPLPFEPSIAMQYTRRFEQLVTAKTPMLAVNDFNINGSFSWDTISFPFTCKLLFWERPAIKTATNGTGVDTQPGTTVSPVTTPASLPAPASTNCLGAEIDLGSWYLPLDLTSGGTQKVEGYGDVSILIPLSDFSAASDALTYVTKTDPTKFQLRIKYSDAVNQSNNYARTRGWTFGIVAIK
jgi:hypothetical protein